MNRTLRLALMTSAALSLTATTALGAPWSSILHRGGKAKPVPAAAAPASAPGQGERIGQPMVSAYANEPKRRAGVWAQTYADIMPDPAIRFGTLPNGMRYELMHNATPTGQASFRLRFDTGSLMETEQQRGLAHFLEHMAFNGSKNVPEGDMIKILERHGLSFGADTNAHTGFDETVYELDLPQTDDPTVDTSLMLLREVASNLTIAPDAVDRERGVVLSEERTSDTPALRVYKASSEFFLPGQLVTERLPIGLADVLKTAPASLIQDYYHRFYRPERTTFVAVGDFDVDKMEAKIKAQFGDWTATGPAGTEPDYGVPHLRGEEFKTHVEPGSSWSAQIAWPTAPDLSADSKAHRRRDTVETLGFAVLNRRFDRLARSGEPPFSAAGAFRSNEYKSSEKTQVVVQLQPGRWKEGVSAAEQETRRAIQFGVTQAELDREIDEVRARLRAAAAAQATRRTPALAREYVDNVGDDEVETNPSQDLALFEEEVKGLTAEEVSAALKAAFPATGPLVFLNTPTAIEGGEPALAAAFKASQATAVTAGAVEVAKTWPYESFGAMGKVVERKDIADLDAVFVRFANGVRLTIKPTKFRDQQILVSARVGHGRLDLPRDRVTQAWSLPSAFVEGGLDQLTAEELDNVMRSKIVGARLGVDDEAFVFSGATRPDDLDTEAQLLAAYVAHPGWRPQGFNRLKALGATIEDQQQATASGVFGRYASGLLHSGDKRFVFPSKEEIAAGTPEQQKALLAPSLADGPIEVLVVGDTTVDKAIEAVASTFGALPPRGDAPAPAAARDVAFPAPSATPVELTHKGRADQTIGFIAWPTDDFFANPQEARTLRILGDVLENRMIERLREALGATYSPSAGAATSLTYPHYGYLQALIETPPATLPVFFTEVSKIAADLREHPVSQDELDRAKKPALEALQKSRQTNEYWLGQLSGAQADPRKLDAIRSVVASTERVTPADIQKAAQKYLREDKAYKVQVVPEKK